MFELDIVTPVSRPQNLSTILPTVEAGRDLFDIRWYLIHDCKTGPCDEFNREARVSPHAYHVTHPSSEAGWLQRNWHLDRNERPDAFVWWLDDDGLVAPVFFRALHGHLSSKDQADRPPLAVLFSMAYPHKPPQVLLADPGGMRIGGVSGSMAVMHRSTIGDLRASLTRTSDGSFLNVWWRKVPHNRVLFDPRPLVLYNPLDPTRPE